MTKELERLEEGLTGNTHRLTQNDTKKISNWKTPGHDGIHGFCSRNSLLFTTD